jgi:hypothetical protein
VQKLVKGREYEKPGIKILKTDYLYNFIISSIPTDSSFQEEDKCIVLKMEIGFK